MVTLFEAWSLVRDCTNRKQSSSHEIRWQTREMVVEEGGHSTGVLSTVLTSRCEMVCVMERGEAMTLKSSAGMRALRRASIASSRCISRGVGRNPSPDVSTIW